MPIYGRDAVLRTCRAALNEACAGRGRVLLLTGEAGIGKTTVARALAAEAAEVGAVVRWSACWDEGALPFGPWVDLLRQSAGDPCAGAATILAREAEDADDDPTAFARVRRRTFDRVVDALRASAVARPQFAVIEDLHWADAGSILLLRALTAQISAMPVLVVVTCRDEELPAEHSLWNLGGGTERIDLERLGPADVRRLLMEVLGRGPTAAEASAVDARAGGNPLFVSEVGRLMTAGVSLGVPSGVRTVLARRLARLPTPCHRTLGAAAVLGAEFDPDVVATMLDRPQTEILDDLDAAAVARIAGPVLGRGDRWAFAHALLQETRYEGLGSAERAALHRQACEVLDRRTVPARVLAHHALRGRFGVDDTRPASLAADAADEARARLAVEEAAELYEAALERTPAGSGGDEVRARAWLGLGEVSLRAGDAAGAWAAFEAAAALARARGDGDLLARAALGFGAGFGGFEVRMLDERQTAMLEEAAGALAPDSALRPWVLARLSVALSFLGPESRRLALSDEAVALARRSGNAAALGAALAARCDALAGPAFAAERAGIAAEITAIGLRLTDRHIELLGRRLRVKALAELCDLDALDAEAAAFERGAAALADPLYSWYGPLWRAMRALGHGRMGEAQRLRDEARAVGAQAGSGNARVLTVVLDLFLGLETGQLAAFRASYDGLGRDFPELLLANAAPMLAYSHALLDVPGWQARAAAALAEVDQMPVDAEWLCTIAPLTELCWLLDRPDAARELYARFAPFAGLGVVEGIAAVHRGPTDRWLMMLAALAGDAHAAVEHVDRALDLAPRNGALVLAGTRHRAADVLRRIGGHERRAAELEAAARAGFTDLGLPARACAGGVARVAAPEPMAAAMVREGDTWAITWDSATVRIRHAKGVADLALLLGRPGREVHVRELAGAVIVAADGGRQTALDAAAVASYKQRLLQIEADLDEADGHADPVRGARMAAERDALVAELSAAFGLGGRPRLAGPDPDERLRKAVSARVKVTVERLAQLHPPLGRHLRNAVHTGMWCSYLPERPVTWRIAGGR